MDVSRRKPQRPGGPTRRFSASAPGRRGLLGLAAGLGLAGPMGGLTRPGHADPSPRDLQAAVRALAFLENPPSGRAEIGIVYPADSAAGFARAQRIAAGFGDGLQAGSLTLHPRLVTIPGLQPAGLVALLLTEEAIPDAARVAAAVNGTGIVTITAGSAAADSGAAVLSVRSGPRMEIVVNRAAAQAAGVSFAAAFRMMIQER